MTVRFEDLNMPAVVYAPHLPDGWRKTLRCRWQELEESLRRRDNAAAAMIDENHRFAEACEMLRPVMEANPSMTVGEALLVINYEVGGT